MAAITMEDIIESNRLKKEACNNCKEDLKDKLTPEQLQKFEDVFYTVAKKSIYSVGKRKMLIRKISRNIDVSML